MANMTPCDLHNETIIRLQSELAEARAENATLKADAERYRHIVEAEDFDLRVFSNDGWAHLDDKAEADAAIDAAKAAIDAAKQKP